MLPKIRLNPFWQLLTLGAVVAFLPRGVSAEPMTLTGDVLASEHGLGDFRAVLSYSFTGPENSTLSVELSNTSPVGNGGYITALAFNNPYNWISSVTLTTAADFELLGVPTHDDSVNAHPFGLFDIGATTRRGFQGGGPPSQGIAAGETETFWFDLTGVTGLDELTEQDFASSMSDPNSDLVPSAFVVRFRGFANDGSDKVPAAGPTTTTTPEATSMALWLTVGLGLMAARILPVSSRGANAQSSVAQK